MDVKLCPDCGAEYYAHVDNCIDCGSKLMLPDVIEEIEAVREDFLKQSGGDVVVIREGKTDWIKSLRHVLNKNEIPSLMSLAPDCKPGGCSSTSLLFISKAHAEKADEILHEYYLSTNPEAEHERDAEEENCPACGFEAGVDVNECPDCGLALIV